MFENKIEKNIKINDELDDATNDKNVMHYWHEEFQLTEEDETIILHPNGWFNDQHMRATMQMLYINKLQSIKYEHTYAIIGKINRIINIALNTFSVTIIIRYWLKYTHPHLVHIAQYMIENPQS